MFNNRYQFDRILGTSVSHQAYILYSKALSFQKNVDLASLEKVQAKLIALLRDHLKPERANFIGKKTTIAGVFNFFNGTSYLRLRQTFFLAKMLLQRTAVMSQLNQHQKAFRNGMDSFSLIQSFIRQLRNMLGVIINAGDSFEGRVDFDPFQFHNYFSFLCSITIDSKGFDKTKKKYDWKVLQSDSMRMIIDKVKTRNDFSPLKAKVDASPLKDFHISEVVILDSLENEILSMNERGLNGTFLQRAALLLACSCFTIATENRFISHNEIQNLESSKLYHQPEKNRELQEISRELKLQKHSRFI